jgi:hypothetical protein
MQHLLPLIDGLAGLFERLDLRHAFGGALANNFWGIVRTTQDVDCLVLIPAIQYQRLADELNGVGCVLRDEAGNDQPVTVAGMRRQEQERKLIELWQNEARAELFVPFLPLQDEILRRAVRLPFENRTLSVTTAEDLVLLKMVFHREKDLIDVRGILWVQRGKLDLNYLRDWSGRMLQDDVAAELDEMVREYQDSSD